MMEYIDRIGHVALYTAAAFALGYLWAKRPWIKVPRTEPLPMKADSPTPLPPHTRSQIRNRPGLDITSLPRQRTIPRLHTVDDFDSEDTQR